MRPSLGASGDFEAPVLLSGSSRAISGDEALAFDHELASVFRRTQTVELLALYRRCV